MILIVGAGITGLTCAACLTGEVVVVEAQEAVGGYCRTTKRNGFVWDRAGHFFHFQNPDIKKFFQKEIPEDRFVKVKKKSAIHMEDIGSIDFPFQKNIHQLPKDLYVNCLLDLYKAEKNNSEYSSFKEFAYATAGKSIAELFLIPYNEKLYACDLDELDKDAMGRFFPKASFEDVLLNADQKDNDSYNADFSYPREGAEEFVNVLHNYANKSADIRLNTTIESIDIEKKEARLSDGTCVKYTALINTSPFNKFCELASIDSTKAKLSANKVAVFNLGFDKKSQHDMHWVYFPGDEIFYRVGSYHNIHSTDRASLYVEIGLKSGDIIDEKSMLANVLKDLERTKLINTDMNLIDYEFIVMDPAYVHINSQGEQFKEEQKKSLEKHNVYTAGRYGNWTYCSIEDNMVEARDLSKAIALKLQNCANDENHFVNIFE
ncbi:FAD-dependent oxidoreductase [Colwellia sp. 1_MG-2023]|uniref:protoporphyrinogen/coproporphyrinogen oxidase n=1 Tax=unclassified Colwellia TaxID=196834 RepID=UPI001C0871F0|nr:MULTISPECIES: FAD-dependent oxidoreductase [unclassified Colwellia]MBU2925112.1 FAD-dependent oxidoreductase [Colwellia sp. C2M11]MDO6653391.1 FAD-dependent oxidoreductase [Colwellia sp. 3_MG-2023]MDO6666175.1 FAD-dependent oxidoreductase [Colwellia sp. 2_MG-2023]MDO6690548.1 FAD-dependent oxidoreductase [Colwellia sp. 1_MG-2023]